MTKFVSARTRYFTIQRIPRWSSTVLVFAKNGLALVWMWALRGVLIAEVAKLVKDLLDLPLS